MGFSVKINCGPLVDNDSVIWLPMEGEVVHQNSNYGPVNLIIFNANDVDAKIKEIRIEPPLLMEYFDFKNLIGKQIDKKKTVNFKDIILTNKKNPELSGKNPKLTIVFEYQQQQSTPFSYELYFSIKPFPDFQEILAVDFGNTSTAIVICKPSVPGFGPDCLKAINLDEPTGGETTQSTAILFEKIENNKLVHWKVGEAVKHHFEAEMLIDDDNKKTLLYNANLRAYKFGGIKKLLGVSQSEKYFSFGAVSENNPLIINGNEINKYVLQEFLERTERNTFSETNQLVGRIRGIRNVHSKIVATHPVNYTPDEIKSLALIWSDLKVPNVDFKYDEATSCAIYYLTKHVLGLNKIAKFWAELETIKNITQIKNQLPVNNLAPNVLDSEIRFFNMLVFDCGGGTIDIALLRVEIEKQRKQNTFGLLTENYFVIRPTVIGLTGKSDFAGDHMTLEAVKLIKLVLLKKIIKFLYVNNIAKIELLFGENDDKPVAIDALNELIKNHEQKSNNELLEMPEVVRLCKRALPTHYQELLSLNPDGDLGNKNSAEARKLWKDLWDLAEQAKKDLASKPTEENVVVNVTKSILDLFKTTEVDQEKKNKSLKDEVSLLDLELSRTELDAMLIKDVSLAWEYAADLCKDLDEKEINQVVLAGNGSKYPLIKQGLKETFCLKTDKFQYEESKILEDLVDAKFACAKGSAIAKALELTTAADDFDSADQTVISFKPISNQILPFSFVTLDDSKVIKNWLFRRGTKIPENNVLFMMVGQGELGDSNAMPTILTILKLLKSSVNDKEIIKDYVEYGSFEPRPESDFPAGFVLKDLRYRLEIDNQLQFRCNTFWIDPADKKKRLHEKFADFKSSRINVDSNSPHSGKH